MKFPVLTSSLCAALLLTGCKTQRTVLAGPTVTGVDSKALSDPKIQSTGFQSNSGLGRDRGGYEQNSSGGLNAMSEKMFSGKLDTQSKKEFAANKNFLTREYGGKKDFAAKAWKGAPRDKTWTDKLFDTDERSDGDITFHDAGRAATVKDSPDATKMANTKDFAGADRTARTGNYRPAEKALESGRDKPKLSSAKPDRMNSDEKAVRDRIASSEATASEINKFLGKP